VITFVTLSPFWPSVVPTLKYVNENILPGYQPFFLDNKMERPVIRKSPKDSRVKTKQRLALALRIDQTNRRVNACGRCASRRQSCFLDPALATRCSGCVRSKCACSSDGVLWVPRSGPVCVFNWSPRLLASLQQLDADSSAIPPTPPRSLSPAPIMDLDFFLNDLGMNSDGSLTAGYSVPDQDWLSDDLQWFFRDDGLSGDIPLSILDS